MTVLPEEKNLVNVEKSVLSASQRVNWKFYNITENYQKRFQQLIERISNTNYQYLYHEIKRVKEDYRHKYMNEKFPHMFNC